MSLARAVGVPAREIFGIRLGKEGRQDISGWDQYRVELAMGRNLQLNPSQYGPKLNSFGYPFTQIGPKTLDWLDPASFGYKITYSK